DLDCVASAENGFLAGAHDKPLFWCDPCKLACDAAIADACTNRSSWLDPAGHAAWNQNRAFRSDRRERCPLPNGFNIGPTWSPRRSCRWNAMLRTNVTSAAASAIDKSARSGSPMFKHPPCALDGLRLPSRARRAMT